jgi:hypothetical protein
MPYTYETVDLDAVIQEAQALRSQALAEMINSASKRLGRVFISELRTTRESALARLTQAA